MSPALALLVVALAVARVTRLLTADRILDRPRERLVARLWARQFSAAYFAAAYPKWSPDVYPAQALAMARERKAQGAEPPLLPYLVTCPWCVSTYVGILAAPAWWFAGTTPWVLIPAAALACSYVTGFLASKES